MTIVPKATVLVVDDEPLIRRLIHAILSRRGYAVLEAEDGHDGLERLESHASIDLILSDIAMPKLDGLALARAVHARRPALPVLFMSGYSGRDHPGLGEEELGRLLNKPFTPQELMARVEQALHHDGW